MSELDKLYKQLQTTDEKVSIFTDLDLTSCNIYNEDYAKENGNGSYMQPQVRKAFGSLRSRGAELYIVTGRHWEGYRTNDITGERIKDGALHDLLGGDNSEFKNCKAVAGHGRTLTIDGKTTVLGRTKGKELEEQQYATYVGKRVLHLKQNLFKKYPDMRGVIGADFKKHLSFVDVKPYVDNLTDKDKIAEIKDYIREQMQYIVDGKDENGKVAPNAPQNPGNIYKFVEEPTGSMEIRTTNWNKRRGIEASGFLEEALKASGPVIVMGDSLGKNGTDRDLFEAANEFFTKNGARDRLFLIQVVNNKNDGIDKQIYDANDPCKPDIAVASPDHLGEVLTKAAEIVRAKQASQKLADYKKNKTNITGLIINKQGIQR